MKTELNKLAKELNKKFNDERKSDYTSFRGYVSKNIEEGTIKLPEWCDEFDLYEACEEIEY